MKREQTECSETWAYKIQTPGNYPEKKQHTEHRINKYYTAGQAIDGNMAHDHCMLDICDCKHTLRICNTYCFSTVTVFTRKRLSVTYSLHCLSCLFKDPAPLCIQYMYILYTIYTYISFAHHNKTLCFFFKF